MNQTMLLSSPTPMQKIWNNSRANGKSRWNCNSTCNFPLASRIIVKNLGYSVGESSLQKEFSYFGEIAEVKLVKNDGAKKSKAYAFIQYTSEDGAILALENMDRKIFDGRLIYVDLAKPGRGGFGGYPKASGPPKKRQQLPEEDEVVDCWY
ncbi:small RNA-binding protein 11, chloroplastic [Mercurialis annua]|uniref:small RNA-binding protein 11, chloroplastic n=1 Tax=Mercurialis annua TaxID=3986 RepID=UPI0021609A76|nr:small RNA-binding protein 11, chloroplastic [Mercurialis annua]